MKRKLVLRLLSLSMVAAVAGTMLPSNAYFVNAAGNTAETQSRAGQEDGINDDWAQDPDSVAGTGAICAVEDGWLHLKSDPSNGNNPGTKPAMFVNPNTLDFSSEGYFDFTMKSNNANTGVADSDRFGVYLGYNTDQNGMFVGYDNGGWFWQKYTGGNGDWYSGNRHGAPSQGEEVQVHIAWTADQKMTLELDGETVFENEDFSGIKGSLGNKIAFKCGSWGENVTDVLVKDIHYAGQAEAVAYQVTGKVTDAQGSPLEGAKVTAGDAEAVTDKDGKYTLELADGTYEITVSKSGYVSSTASVTVSGQNVTAADIQLDEEADIKTETLSTEDMDVYVSRTFPSVVKYEMKGNLKGKTFYGQTDAINTVKINGVDVKVDPEDVKATFDGATATYVMDVKDEANHIDAKITAELKAEANQLAFNITKIENRLQDQTTTNKYGDEVETYPVQTIAIPNHSLISVRSTQSGANLKGAVMSSNTHKSGDELIEVNSGMGAYTNRDYMYAFVSNDEMSAGIWSNSEHEGRVVAAPVNGGSQNTRIYATSQEKDGYKTMGLASAEWYYHRNVTDSKGVAYTVTETEMPQTKIVIAGDMNEDAQIDWQDGAIAFRDIMNNPYKSEEVPELVAWRIAMNFGGQAQNPFLTTLDNVKRVALHTDGLGQSILLKGYGSEGHDSGHPDYENIGERIGGAEDMNTLMEEGAEYGARFGIHVNASEMYPEAQAFSENLVRRYDNGGLRYGWNWLDQGIGIDGIYDLASGERQARFDALKEKVGDNMDFIYLDVWGNLTSGSREDSWETRKMSDMITDNGWRMTTEWGSGNEYDSTFQHWACDLTYGGYTSKGENSEVMRFLRNHQKDSWVGDYPSYGGVANAPLLGGYNMKDFEGWQGRNDYDAYITNLYTHDVMTKFLQHYQVVKWEDGDPVQMTDNGETYTWTPEKEITLKADPEKSAAETDTVVVTRGSTNPSDAAYRDRTVTLNGIVISQGAVTRGDNSSAKGTESYLIPWIWDSQTGDEVSADEEKLYHWNTQGGTTTWELQDDWKGLSNVKVYKLTDLGKTEEQTVAVENGKITLTAEAETPYVVCKGDEANLEITWSEGMHIVDAGFNSGNDGLNEYWDKAGEGTAEIAKSQYSNPMMKLDGEVSMTQELTDLTPGEKYAVYVGVDNRSTAKAYITAKAGDEVLDSNYTEKSIAKNYIKAYTHSNSSATVDGSSYFQNMYIFFTAPKSGTVTLTLSRDAGEGSTYFDDIRVVESAMDVVKKDENGNVIGMEQDFENNAQGVYPFVIGSIEGVEDNRTHLSELHAPYTQAGWDVKKVDDVLDGNWSVKTNGLVQRNALVYQTIPQNFRFEPGVKYRVSFDYQSGSNGTYALTVGAGEFAGGTPLYPLEKAMGEDGHYSIDIIGDVSGQTWFGIYSTSTAADLQGTSGSEADFGGYKDFILDNLVIEIVDEEFTAEDLEALIQEAESGYDRGSYTAEDWKYLADALTGAKVALNKDHSTSEDIQTAYYTLRAAMQYMDSIDPSSSTLYDISLEDVILTTPSEELNGTFGSGCGPKEYAIDGDPQTGWMTAFDGWSSLVAAGDGWLDMQYPEAHTVDGVRYMASVPSSYNYNVITDADYEIWVKTADAVGDPNGERFETEGYQKVAEGTWAYDSSWKMVEFEAVENVTNIRLILTRVADHNYWSLASEIRGMSKTEAVIEDIPVDKTALETAIGAAQALTEENYTEESWGYLQDKLAAAIAVNENADADAYDVELARVNLVDAMEMLVEAEQPQPADKETLDRLQNLVDEYSDLKAEDYTEASWKPFADAMTSAKAVLADENATQSAAESAIALLQTTRDGLVEASAPAETDKSAAEKFYNECLAYYKEADHSAENWKAYQDALAALKAVLDDPDATQDEVNAALNSLVKITAELNKELKGEADTPKEPEQTDVSGNGAAKTGDTVNVMVWGFLTMAATMMLVAVLLFLGRRNRR